MKSIFSLIFRIANLLTIHCLVKSELMQDEIKRTLQTNFTPSVMTSNNTAPVERPINPCNAARNQESFQLRLKTDYFAKETSWNLYEGNSGGFSVGSRSDFETNTEYDEFFCLSSDRCYLFSIYDAYNDGLCCEGGQGYYSGILNGKTIFSGGEFEAKASHHFCLPSDGCSGLNVESLDLTLQTDYFGKETSWELIDLTSGNVIEKGSDFETNTEYKQRFCLLPKRCYKFIIYDKLSDGICCEGGQGYYSGIVNEEEIFSGGKFQSQAEHSFCLSMMDDALSLSPSSNPTVMEPAILRLVASSNGFVVVPDQLVSSSTLLITGVLLIVSLLV